MPQVRAQVQSRAKFVTESVLGEISNARSKMCFADQSMRPQFDALRQCPAISWPAAPKEEIRCLVLKVPNVVVNAPSSPKEPEL